MGSKYVSMILDGNIKGMELCAVTHFKEQYRSLFHFDDDHPVRVFESADAMYGALDRGDLDLDAVIIAPLMKAIRK